VPTSNLREWLASAAAVRREIDLLIESSLKGAAAFAAAAGDMRLIVDATGFLHDETQRPERAGVRSSLSKWHVPSR